MWYLILAIITVQVSPIVVSWNPNSESDLAGYRVYVGMSSRQYGGVSPDIPKTIQSFSWNNLRPDTTRYYFAVTAYDSSGNESDFSEEVFWPPEVIPAPVDTTKPAAPATITITGPLPEKVELHYKK